MASKFMSICFLALALIGGPAVADLYEQKPAGWVWYDDSAPPATAPKPDQPTAPAVSQQLLTAKETLKHYGDLYEEAEAKALLNPTDDNIKDAIQKKQAIFQLSEIYADRYEQVVWKNPELDYTLQRPMETQAQWTAGPVQYAKAELGLKAAADTWAIVYVFRSDCPFCKKFSPILKTFAALYGFTVLPVTLDGQGSADFPYPKTDINVLREKNILPQVVPAIYLVDPKKNETQTVGFGVMSMDQLRERLGLAAGVEMNGAAVTQSGLAQAPAADTTLAATRVQQ